MALGLKPRSYANSRKTGGRTSPLVKPKNFFTRYVDILNNDADQSSPTSSATSSGTDSVSSRSLSLISWLLSLLTL